MKKINILISLLILNISALFLSSLTVNAQNQGATSTNGGNRFLDTVRLGMSYQAQEFYTLNQKLSDNCNCDESLRLGQRALQSISLSLYEPLTNRWSFGANFGGSWGSVMNDNRVYKRYSFAQLKAESFYYLFAANTKLRPYLSGSVQFAANSSKAFLSLPLGAGLRFNLAKGGFLHLQTAYDGGLSPNMARNMITNLGFHVPLLKRKVSKPGASGGSAQMQTSWSTGAAELAKQSSDAAKVNANPSNVAPANNAPAAESPQSQTEKSLALNQSPKPNQEESADPKPLVRMVYFDNDQFISNKSATEKVLAEVLAFLKENKNVIVYLSGHTDNVANASYNLALSKKRVEWVASKLTQLGISADLIDKKYYGESSAITNNQYEAGRASNRRVEIIVK